MSSNYIILEPALRPVTAGWTRGTNKQGNVYIFGGTHKRARGPGIIYFPRCLAVRHGGYPKIILKSPNPAVSCRPLPWGIKTNYPINYLNGTGVLALAEAFALANEAVIIM